MPSNSVTNSNSDDDLFKTLLEGGGAFQDRVRIYLKVRQECDTARDALNATRKEIDQIEVAAQAKAAEIMASARREAAALRKETKEDANTASGFYIATAQSNGTTT
jgi:hypothetical protein